MKFRIDRDVLADAVAWTARTLPVRPPVPGARGHAHRGRGQPQAVLVRLRGLRPDDDGHRRRRAGHRAGVGPPPRRDLPQPARAAGRDHHRRRQGHAQVRHGEVHTADHACGGLPEPAGDAAGRRDRRQRRVRRRRLPGRPRRRSRRHPADAHRRTAGDRGRDRDARLHRPLPARRTPAPAGSPSSPTSPRSLWCPPRRSPTPPSPSPRVRRSRSLSAAGGQRRGHDRLRGRRPPYDHPAARRRVREVPVAVAEGDLRGRRDRDRPRSPRRSSASAWSRRRTPRYACRSARARSSWRPAAATTHRLWKFSAPRWRARTSTSPSTRTSCSTASARSAPTSRGWR